MDAPLSLANEFHYLPPAREGDLGEYARVWPTASRAPRIEFMRPSPRYVPPEPDPIGLRAADAMVAAGEAGVLWMAGVAVGCALVVAANTVAGVL